MSKGSLTFFKLLVSLFLVSIPFMEAESQSIDMLLLETAKTNAAKSSLDFIGAKSSPLLNGKEYLVYHPREKEHPYFTINWLKGSIVYNGDLYSNILLLYDISTDQVITKYFTGDHLCLVKPFIASFTLENRKFTQLHDLSLNSGFYEVLSDKKIKVYAKHEKVLRETPTFDPEIHLQFEERTRYLINVNGSFFEVKNKKSLLLAFASQAAALKQFMREKKLKFKSSTFEGSLVQVIAFCEQLP